MTSDLSSGEVEQLPEKRNRAPFRKLAPVVEKEHEGDAEDSEDENEVKCKQFAIFYIFNDQFKFV
jgi:hypothetical protein